MAEKATHTIA